MFEPVPQKIDFPALEKRILAFWKEHEIFEKSLRLREGAERFIFYEGPPTANGMPHNGHVLTRVIKDLFPRYKTMRGYQVPRKAGWDTHGLPVEVEVEKELGIHGKSDIEAYGLEAFTKRCIESVFRYTDVWEELTERIGFWIDLSTAYVTFHKSYVESVWWALKTLHERGLLYQGHKVVWWWPSGGTALSAGEVGLGYRTIDDPSVTVRFPIIGEEGCSFLAWTTTPWTLPSNCALCVNPRLDYVYAQRSGDDDTYVVAAAMALAVLGEEHTVLRTVKGSELLDKRYVPLFDYARPEEGDLHKVIPGDFVTATDTGVVHTAPAFGEDDHKVCKQNGIGMLQLIKPDGTFVDEVAEFAGRFCKEADRDIIRHLKQRRRVFADGTYRHEYPFCWRASEDPLIQYARPAWFIRTTDVIARCIENNQATNWLPGHLKDGRFGDFLANNVDWALSRERFWGTPLPLWLCPECEHVTAVGSTAELTERNPEAFASFREAQKADPELSEHLCVHKPWIDEVTLPCEGCGHTMRRVPEVIDCWFDSGCMPFAQWGYPHQGKEDFEKAWPADFISEGIDQTRGWFYSLMMISTLLFDEAPQPHPYKSCIALGHVCDKDGKKESKSQGNFTPPDEILDTYGADAMRWYFYSANPPYNNTRYSPEAVREAQKEFLVKLHNVYSFFVIYANIDGFDPETSPRSEPSDRSLIDRWILSELNLAVRDVTGALDDLKVYESAQRLITLGDAISNWYVRRCRGRFWSPEKDQDKWDAYHTLHEVLTTVSRTIAPFVPFFADDVYRNLTAPARAAGRACDSVHLCDWPEADAALIDESLSEEMQAVRDVVSLGLSTRAMHKLRVRQPLAGAEIILGKAHLADRLMPHTSLITEELNVKAVTFVEDSGGRVGFEVKPNYRQLGPRFGKRMPVVRKALDGAEPEAVRTALARDGQFELTLPDGEPITLTSDLVQVTAKAAEGYAASGGPVGTVILNTRLSDELVSEGLAREITSKIQGIRKDQALDYTARIAVHVGTDDTAIAAACEVFKGSIMSETLAVALTVTDAIPAGGMQIEAQIEKKTVAFRLEVA